MAVETTTEGGGGNEVQRVGFSSANPLYWGTFTLSFDGQTTGAISFDASASTVEAALAALSNIGSGNVSVVKSEDTTSAQEWQITFQGALGGADQPQTTIDAGGVYDSYYTNPTTSAVTDQHGGGGNEVQVVSVSGQAPPGGMGFTLSFDGQTTDPLSYEAAAAEVEEALEGLSTIGSGNVSVSGDAGGVR